jgi:hypothetical protein
MNLRLVTVILGAALVLPAAAGAQSLQNRGTPDPRIADGTLQRRLDSARKAWKASNIRSYRYEVGVSCFCVPAKGVVYVVRKGVPKVPAAGEKSVATVPRLFRKIQEAIDDDVADLDVTYGTRGVPRKIHIDTAANIADEEVGYTITRFKPLAR